VTRAQVNRGYWPGTPPYNGVYPNVPQDTHARGDLEEFVARAGALPDAPDPAQPWADWGQPATREWTARVIWQAFSVPGGASR